MSLVTMKETPRIYVASLSDYNAGTLHGVWIDVGADTTVDDIHQAVAEMLEMSPEARICQRCGSPVAEHLLVVDGIKSHDHAPFPGNAEEWAIHDYDGFGNLNLGEWESFDRVAELGAAIEEHGIEVVSAFLDDDPDADLNDISNRYMGEWESIEHYVMEFYDGIDLGPLESYIDFGQVGRDWASDGAIITVEVGWRRVLIFSVN